MFLFKFDLGHTFEHKDGLHTIIQKCEKWEKKLSKWNGCIMIFKHMS